MYRPAVVLILLSTVALSHAKRQAPPPSVRSESLDVTKPLPGIKVTGKRVIAAWRFTAPDGKVGHLVLSSTETTSKKSIGPGRNLFAQLFTGDKPKQVRLVQDGFPGCNVALRAAFVQGSVSFDDVDGDNLVEAAFAYDLACDDGEGRTTRKLLVLEGPAKYVLRGESRDVATGTAGGGTFKAEGLAKQGAIATWAEARWETLLATAPVAVDP